MTGLMTYAAASLAAVLAERFLLDRYSGRTPFHHLFRDQAGAAVDTCAVAAVLTLGTLSSWAIAAFLLVPARLEYLYGALLTASFFALAPAAGPVLSGRFDAVVVGRVCLRAAALSSLLGITLFVPEWAGRADGFPGFYESLCAAATASAVFALVRYLCAGLREHVSMRNGRASAERPALVMELLIAGLAALALYTLAG